MKFVYGLPLPLLTNLVFYESNLPEFSDLFIPWSYAFLVPENNYRVILILFQNPWP
jgi:hypothetical protein